MSDVRYSVFLMLLHSTSRDLFIGLVTSFAGRVRVIDITTPFLRHGGVDDTCFEKWMGMGCRRHSEGIHLNAKGMGVPMECLDRRVWDSIYQSSLSQQLLGHCNC
ncbi:uncharacterized protein LOC124157088 [Ischnura elegans]|uniref:uncharacterized protein LOC124157088 n=1 Tax=Ischnura elegans TaxID=197161 RepID=UPI001ED878BC|nr:uncharacterized protein LOC124157088 [Ischnura elegans]